MLSSAFRIVFVGVVLCVSVCVSHFASVFTILLPTLDFLHMPAWKVIKLQLLSCTDDDAFAVADAAIVFMAKRR